MRHVNDVTLFYIYVYKTCSGNVIQLTEGWFNIVGLTCFINVNIKRNSCKKDVCFGFLLLIVMVYIHFLVLFQINHVL